MAVKRSQTVARALSIVETIAAQQPISVSALARLLGEDRSAVQRIVMTLADAGWIQAVLAPPLRWEISAHLFSVAQLPHSSSDLSVRSQQSLEDIRDRTGETVLLTMPNGNRFIVINAAESREMLRMSPGIGEILISSGDSATGRAILPYVSPERQSEVLGRAPDPAEAAEFAATRKRGYSLSIDAILSGVTNVGAPVFNNRGEPMAAIVVTGPSGRVTRGRYDSIGKLLVWHAQHLSHGAPATNGG